MEMTMLLAGVGDNLSLDEWFAELEIPGLSGLWAEIDLSGLLIPLVHFGPDPVPVCPD